MTYLRIRNIHKRFPGHQALAGVDLNIEKGETLAIMGPSGCGKTTLLRCLALFETIDEGEIVLNGSPIVLATDGENQVHVSTDQYRAKTGMVFQHLNIWPHLTVLENLTLGPRVVRGFGNAEVIDKAEHQLARMGVAEKRHQYPAALSGGQLQRVALSRALMMDPEILLLDEITSALDPELVGEVLDVIADLAASGMTMLVVTHEVLFATEVATRIAFMQEGTMLHVIPAGSIFSGSLPDRLSLFFKRLARHRYSMP